MDMKDNPNKLDDIIREKLGDLGSPYRPETWDWLSDRLDTLEDPVDQLDGIIRGKMAGFGVAYRPETWDWLSERLEGEGEGTPAGAEMQQLDEAIYERMHRLEKPYDPNHWPLLLKKLEANAYVGQRIVRYKAMELSLLALLLITFIRLPFDYGNVQPQQTPPAHQLRPQAANEAGVQPAETLASGDIAQADGETSTSLSQPGNTSGTVAAAGSAGNTAASYPLPSESVLPSIQASIAAAAARYFGITTIPGAITDLSQLPSEVKELAIPASKDLPVAANHSVVKTDPTVLALHSGNVLGVMAYLPANLMQPLCQTCIGKLDKEALTAKQPTFFRIGMQGGPDYNRVITPPVTIAGDTYQADRYSLGYSGGLTFALEKDRWELETGLIYSSKRYFPLPVVVLDGSVEEGFFGNGTKQFDLEVFQVPLNFRYNFVRKNRWRVYALGGMSLHLTTQSNYYLAEPEGFETDNFQPQPRRPDQEFTPRDAPSIKSEFDNFTKGWLEGGSFNKNSYISGNLGIGIERFITDYWSIYVQPTYSHSMIYLNGGLGPYYDKIHTNSMLFGVKVRLK